MALAQVAIVPVRRRLALSPLCYAVGGTKTYFGSIIAWNAGEADMDKMLTVSEMRNGFPSEWLIVVDPETDESGKVTRGEVIFHSKDRDEAYREVIRLHPRRFATIYTGRVARDAAVVL
jgi:hypothetical protein